MDDLEIPPESLLLDADQHGVVNGVQLSVAYNNSTQRLMVGGKVEVLAAQCVVLGITQPLHTAQCFSLSGTVVL